MLENHKYQRVHLSTRWLLLLAALLLACWPVWRWYVLRMAETPEELWNLAALGVAVTFLWQERGKEVPRLPLLVPTLLVLLYAAVYPLLFPLARAAVMMTAIAALCSAYRLGRRLHPGIWGLLLLALPIIPSLQFYLGYPLRLLVSRLAAPMLCGSGYIVTAEGACLRWGGQLIAIDAPCSGVNMLWTGFFLALAMACYLHLSPLRTGLALAGTLLVVIAGNALRASTLFFLEAKIIHGPAWVHTGAGLVVFAATAAGIIWCVHRLGRREACAPSSSS